MEEWERSFKLRHGGMRVMLMSIMHPVGVKKMMFRCECIGCSESDANFPWCSDNLRGRNDSVRFEENFYVVFCGNITSLSFQSVLRGGSYCIVGDISILSEASVDQLVNEGYNFRVGRGGGDLNSVPDNLFVSVISNFFVKSFRKTMRRISARRMVLRDSSRREGEGVGSAVEYDEDE